jgi:hypothetical protein
MDVNDEEFVLNIRLVDTGPVAAVIPSADCTSDNCGPSPCLPGVDDC